MPNFAQEFPILIFLPVIIFAIAAVIAAAVHLAASIDAKAKSGRLAPAIARREVFVAAAQAGFAGSLTAG